MTANEPIYANLAFKDENEQIYANIQVHQYKKAKENQKHTIRPKLNKEPLYENLPLRNFPPKEVQRTDTILTSIEDRSIDNVSGDPSTFTGKKFTLKCILLCIFKNWRLLVTCVTPIVLLPIPLTIPGPVCKFIKLLFLRIIDC